MLLLCTSPSRPSAYGRLRGRVDQEIDPYDLHCTCRGGYQPPAGRWEIDPYRPQSLASLAKAGRAPKMVSRATQ